MIGFEQTGTKIFQVDTGKTACVHGPKYFRPSEYESCEPIQWQCC